jgi:simple sugar transport system ATP-binding protein
MLLCDRIAVIAGGRLSEPTDVKNATIEQIGLLMGGTNTAPVEKETALVQV